jgi:hypothetical protein
MFLKRILYYLNPATLFGKKRPRCEFEIHARHQPDQHFDVLGLLGGDGGAGLSAVRTTV